MNIDQTSLLDFAAARRREPARYEEYLARPACARRNAFGEGRRTRGLPAARELAAGAAKES